MSLTDLSTPPRTSRVRVGLEKAALKSAIGAALAMGVLGAGQAQALVVTVGGQQWDVTTFTGSYSANTTKFNTAASGGQMPWWGSSTTANAFATAVGAQLGTQGTGGPLFGWRNATTSQVGVSQMKLVEAGSPFDGTVGFNAPKSVTYTYAQADLATPVPGPLPALGAAAAFGYSRTLRKRIKATKAVGASATAG